MSVDVMEYDLLMSSLAKKSDADDAVSMSRLLAVLVLTVAVTVAELVLAQVTHSITLLVLVHQNIYNVITLVVSCVTRVKGERSLKNTFGWRRMEVVGSIASLVFLFSLCFATMIEALQTVFHTDHLDTMHHPEWIMLLVGSNLAVWLVSFFVIGGYSYNQSKAVRQDKPNRRELETVSACSSFMKKTRVADVTRDLCGCVFTFLTCSLVYYQVVTEDYSAYLDPIISMIYIVFLIWTCVPLVKASCLILLQTIPGNVEVSLLKKFLLQKFPGILALHEFHTWTFTPGTLVLTGHIMYQNEQVYTEIHGQVETFFNSQGFSQVTIQPEFPPSGDPSEEDISTCTLKCKSEECGERTCCKDQETKCLH
eukprot:GFUD01114168.1.p1 GENE.GFUD01114168.1~~GFUD01114168.1.p1  ORF type:complete len:367 (-),score=88.31 GFUD01114168.1:241-1341(-)